MKTLDEFREYYESDLNDKLKLLEQEKNVLRVKVIISNLKTIIYIVASFVGIVLFEKIVYRPTSTGLMVLYIILGAIYIVLSPFVFLLARPKEIFRFRKKFKKEIIENIIKFYDESFEYYPEKYILESDITSSLITNKTITGFYGNDYICGNVSFNDNNANIFIEVSEVTVRHSTIEGESETIFDGLFFKSEFNKDITSSVKMMPETIIFKTSDLKGFDKVNLENSELTKYFDVYAENQVEARYILSPSLISRILALIKKINKRVYISFVGKNIYIGIFDYKDLFEFRFSESLCDFDVIKRHFENLQFLIGIVEELNLNTRIWSKV
ncbi:MAG: hypothetical protein A2Y24_06030 [Clostridiales bacterium GWE2_32_10]|nr:MAG: hypothetical protein A2Y24_06030 [Clostridiales bacterium GWE2_32_10]